MVEIVITDRQTRTMALIADLDLFYTYTTLHDVFAARIAAEAKAAALYLVYGFNRILPRYDHLQVVIPDLGSEDIAALYRKQ